MKNNDTSGVCDVNRPSGVRSDVKVPNVDKHPLSVHFRSLSSIISVYSFSFIQRFDQTEQNNTRLSRG